MLPTCEFNRTIMTDIPLSRAMNDLLYHLVSHLNGPLNRGSHDRCGSNYRMLALECEVMKGARVSH